MASRPRTSFEKKPRGGRRVEIAGTKPSLHNNRLLVSTGVPSLDAFLGGGVAVGSLILVEEDVVGSFAALMLRYFVAEGVACGHPFILATSEPDAILKHLPQAVSHDTPSAVRSEGAAQDSELKIAWRYKDVSGDAATATRSSFGRYFDLGVNVDEETLAKTRKRIVDVGVRVAGKTIETETAGMVESETDSFLHVMRETREFLTQEKSFVDADVKPEERRVCRVAVQAAGSPLWSSSSPFFLPRFFFSLKSLTRRCFAVSFVTVPTASLMPTGAVGLDFVRAIEHLADYAVALKSFAGTDQADDPVFKDYHGLLRLVKLPKLNSLTAFVPETLDLAFKLRRKRFTVERLHLPPELAETREREQDETTMTKKKTMKKMGAAVGSFGGGCGGMSGGSDLDF